MRADFKLLEQVDRQRIVWAQQVENTPFARVLRSAETEITLAGFSEGHATRGVALGGHAAASLASEGHAATSLADGGYAATSLAPGGHAAGSLADGHGEHPPATEVTIELRQELQGFAPRQGSGLVRWTIPFWQSAGAACGALYDRRSARWAGADHGRGRGMSTAPKTARDPRSKHFLTRGSPASLGAPERMRWWGWGDPLHPQGLPAHALGFLRETIGLAAHPSPPVALEHVELEPASISSNVLAGLREILGEGHVRDDHGDRVLHAAGKGYPDLVRLRSGRPLGAPDAVLYPSTREQLRALLSLCARESLAVVPFGGGTSVVGGVEPLRGSHRAVVALDTGRLTSVLELDECSRMVRVQAGVRARELEGWLGARGLTLGHFPQSFEYVSLGGCAATRSAGQASSGYGRFERMVHGLRMVAPAGDVELSAFPASAAGPGVRELAVGSEGVLGVIDELTLRVRRAPATRIYEGVFFESFEAGVHAFRELAQNHCTPEVARLSDEQETRMSLALAGSGGAKGRLGRAYLDMRGYSGGCLAILGFEGDAEELGARRAAAVEIVRAAGGLRVGRSPGRGLA